MVGATKWKDLKDRAMTMKYKEQDFYKPLRAEEKRLLEALRLDQRIQGDMEELNPNPSNDGKSDLTAATVPAVALKR